MSRDKTRYALGNSINRLTAKFIIHGKEIRINRDWYIDWAWLNFGQKYQIFLLMKIQRKGWLLMSNLISSMVPITVIIWIDRLSFILFCASCHKKWIISFGWQNIKIKIVIQLQFTIPFQVHYLTDLFSILFIIQKFSRISVFNLMFPLLLYMLWEPTSRR